MFRRVAGLVLVLGAAAGAPAQDPPPVEGAPPARDQPADADAGPAPPRVEEKIEVTARASAGADEPAVIDVRPAEVMSVAGSADNIFRTLHTLPGVSPTDEFGSRLSVRGGAPDQNLTVMDGVEIHNPYRIFGLVSAFNPETVQAFELTAGAFSAKYGDRLSSLLIVENRDGRADRRLAGSSALSLTDGNLILEGALPRATGGSWLLTGRRTYYDLVAERFVDQDLPSFADLQSRIVWPLRAGRRLSVSALRSREDSNAVVDGDRAGEQGAFLSNARNDLVAATFDAVWGRSASTRTTVAWYRNTDVVDVEARLRNTVRRSNGPEDSAWSQAWVKVDREAAVRDVSLRQELLVQAPGGHLLEAGFDVHGLATTVRFTAPGDRNPLEANGSSVRGGAGLPDALDSSRSARRGGLWLHDRWQATPALTLEPGLRLEWSGVNRRTVPAPRLSALWRMGESTRARLAFGAHAQSPGYEKFIQADYFIDLTHDGPLDLEHERSRQVVLGLERDLAPGLTARVEAFHKRFSRIIVGRLETEPERRARLATYDFPAELAGEVPSDPIITTTPGNGAGGAAYGFDVYVSRRPRPGARLSGWATYTFGVARREAYGRTYPFDYDRRHAATVVAAVRVREWLDVAATARVASGFPRTPVRGLRVAARPDAADRDGDGNRLELVPERDPDGRPVYTIDLGGVGDMLSARLPAFARLDLRATARPGGRRGRWELYLDVINALDRENVGYVEPYLEHEPTADRPRLLEKGTASIPFLPSFGVRFRF